MEVNGAKVPIVLQNIFLSWIWTHPRSSQSGHGVSIWPQSTFT